MKPLTEDYNTGWGMLGYGEMPPRSGDEALPEMNNKKTICIFIFICWNNLFL